MRGGAGGQGFSQSTLEAGLGLVFALCTKAKLNVGRGEEEGVK